MKYLLTKKDIKERVSKINQLGMLCSLTIEALNNNASLKELNEAYYADKSVILSAMNDIGIIL